MEPIIGCIVAISSAVALCALMEWWNRHLDQKAIADFRRAEQERQAAKNAMLEQLFAQSMAARLAREAHMHIIYGALLDRLMMQPAPVPRKGEPWR